MADAINPSNQNPIHLGLRGDPDGSSKLEVFSQNKKEVVPCKVLGNGLMGRVHSTFLKMTGWVSVHHPDFRDRHVQVFIQQSALLNLQKNGLDITNEALYASGDSNKPDVNDFNECDSMEIKGIGAQQKPNDLPITLQEEIKRFFHPNERQADIFIDRIQGYINGGKTHLVLDRAFNIHGECPDIFHSPLFASLETLSLQGIRELPNSVMGLKALRSLDLSYSHIVKCPQQIQHFTNLRTLCLDFSGVTEPNDLIQFGKECFNTHMSDNKYLIKGAEAAAESWSDGLGPLKRLTQVSILTRHSYPNLGLLLTEDLNARKRDDITVLFNRW